MTLYARKIVVEVLGTAEPASNGNRRRRILTNEDHMILYKQSTAVSMIVGPILDATGAEYASAVIGDLSISKNGGTLTAMAASATLTLIANGYYTLAMTTGNTDTLGGLQVVCSKTGYQMPPRAGQVLPATVYDATVTNAINATGGFIGATGSVTGVSGTIANTTNITAGTITTATNVTTVNGLAADVITAASIATDAIGADEISAAAVTKIQTGLATPTNITSATGIVLASVTHTGAVIPTVTDLTNAPTNGDLTATMKASVTAAVPTVAQIVSGVWQDTTAGDFTTANSIGKSLYNAFTANTSVFTVAALANAPTGAGGPTAAEVATAVWTDTTAGDFTVAGSIGLSVMNGVTLGTGLTIVSVSGSVGSVTTVSTGAITTGSFANGAINSAAIATDAIGSNEISAGAVTKIQAGLATPTNITSATGIVLASVTHTGAVIPTVTTVTNQLTAAEVATGIWQDTTAGDFTTAGSVGKSLFNAFTADTSVFTVEALANAPTGSGAGLDAAGVRAAVGLATANLDVQLAGISAPTAVEVSTQVNADLTAAHGAGNYNLTAAAVNAEVVDALSVDTYGELGSVPAATSSLKDKLIWLFMTARNKFTQTSTTQILKADDGTTTVGTATVSDDGSTFTKGKIS